MSAATEQASANSVSRNQLLVGLVVCAGLAGVSLLAVAQPTGNDPNSWLVWATQLVEGNGINFSVGPSWKPLPVIVNLVPVAISSSVAATLWLWLVRFSALATGLLIFLLVRRYWQGTAGTVGGVIAGLAVFTIQPWTKSAVIGMSEPVLMAMVVGAVLAATQGRQRTALALTVGAGLIRPEIWPFLLAWLGWRAWKGDLTWRMAIALAGAALGLWLIAWYGIPSALGADWTQASDRAAEAMALGSNGRGLIGVWEKDLPEPLIWLLIPAGLVVGLIERKQPAGRQAIFLFLAGVAWLLITFILNALGLEPGIPRYALPTFVIWCCLIGSAIAFALRPLHERLTLAVGIALSLLVLLAAIYGTGGLWTDARVYIRSSDRQLSALNKAGGVKALSGCLPFATSGYPSHARLLARRTDQPLQSFTANPADQSRALVLKSSNPAVGSQPLLPRSHPFALSKTDDWTVIYFGPSSGCTLKAKTAAPS